MSGIPTEPHRAIRQIFRIIEESAFDNPTFQERMTDAMGMQFHFTGLDAVKAADPCLNAAAMNQDDFFKLYRDLTITDLKKLASSRRLATNNQLKAAQALAQGESSSTSKKDVYIKLIWDAVQRDIDAKRITASAMG